MSFILKKLFLFVFKVQAALLYDSSRALFEGINRLVKKNPNVFDRHLPISLNPLTPANLTRLRCGLGPARIWEPAEKIIKYIKKVPD